MSLYSNVDNVNNKRTWCVNCELWNFPISMENPHFDSVIQCFVWMKNCVKSWKKSDGFVIAFHYVLLCSPFYGILSYINTWNNTHTKILLELCCWQNSLCRQSSSIFRKFSVSKRMGLEKKWLPLTLSKAIALIKCTLLTQSHNRKNSNDQL